MTRFVEDERKVNGECVDVIYDKEEDVVYPVTNTYSLVSLLNSLAEYEHKTLVVEDGSVDIDKLEKDGFYVILYRQGSTPPMILTKGEK